MFYKRTFLLKTTTLVLGFCCMVIFSSSAGLAKESPYNATQHYINNVMQLFLDYDICSEKKIGPEEKKALRRDLSKMAGKIFDFDYMCRKAVGPYWRVFTDKQRDQAVSLFTELLEENYFGKLLEHMQEIKRLCGENIRVTGQEMLSSDKAVVKSIIVYGDNEYPVNYIMHEKAGKWQIYNVVIEGVSLIENYSSQFREILGRNKPKAFLQKLQDKVENKK